VRPETIKVMANLQKLKVWWLKMKNEKQNQAKIKNYILTNFPGRACT
jgi:hypothetical protein